jgi:hypothetical protein
LERLAKHYSPYLQCSLGFIENDFYKAIGTTPQSYLTRHPLLTAASSSIKIIESKINEEASYIPKGKPLHKLFQRILGSKKLNKRTII